MSLTDASEVPDAAPLTVLKTEAEAKQYLFSGSTQTFQHARFPAHSYNPACRTCMVTFPPACLAWMDSMVLLFLFLFLFFVGQKRVFTCSFQSVHFYCFRKTKRQKQKRPEPDFRLYLFPHVHNLSRRETYRVLILIPFSRFNKSDFCCSDDSKRLNPNVCMLQHANRLWCPPN